MARSIAPKVSTTRRGRLLRLLGSIVDPRAIAHMIKVRNYYNYTHVAELRRATVGRGVAISPTASFANGHNIVIGDRVHIGANCSLWAGHGTARILVGTHALLAPGVMMTCANYRYNDGAPIGAQRMDEADIVVGRDAWLGYGCVVLAGVTIGDGAIVGAGAVVRRDVPPYGILVGNPGELAGYRRRPGEAAPGALAAEANAAVLDALRREARIADDARLSAPIDEAGLDSFDLVTLRTALEAAQGTSIPDREWNAVATLEDIARLPSLAGPARPSPRAVAAPPLAPPLAPAVVAPPRTAAPGPLAAEPLAVGPGRSLRRYTVNMPQMALSGLGEPWLFKELGDIHWHMITEFLRVPSAAIADETGDRLYSTFTRITLEVEPSLRGFRENGPLEVASRLERHGASFFFADHEASGAEASARARTMSTFAKYGERGKNTSLMKGSPLIPEPDLVPSLPAFPEFGVEYRARRAQDPAESLWDCEYDILPPHDINGVGLLYFAAYPSVFDLCIERREGRGFLLAHSTVSKDVCYFANSEPDETLLFRLHAREEDGPLVRHRASLYRTSDRKRMAEVASVKRRV